MIFMCATYDFQESRNHVIFENCAKNLSFEKIQMFGVCFFFKMAKPVYSRLHFDLIKKLLKNHLYSKTLFVFLHF